MSRRKRLSAVATTALVAAFPVFPLFADDAPSPQTAATLAAAENDAPTASQADGCDAAAAFADFDVSLFEIPDGETAAFYRKRVDDIEREWKKRLEAYCERQQETARASDKSFLSLAALLNAPLGAFPAPDGKFLPAPADSVAARRADALKNLYRRLADDATLSREIRGRYYRYWINAELGAERDGEKSRDFYARLLADEKAKSPLDVGRVLYLKRAVATFDALSKNVRSERQTPLDRGAVEKLLEIPQNESAEFYLDLQANLDAAAFVLRDDPLKDRLLDARREVKLLLENAQKQEAAAFDRAAAEKLLDVPQNESAEFYLALYDKVATLKKQLSVYRWFDEYRDLGRFDDQIDLETLPEINKRLACADDLEPLERVERFAAWVASRVKLGDVDALQTALETATSAEPTSEIDALREPYLERALLEARFQAVRIAASQAAPDSLGRNIAPSLPNDAAIELRQIAAEIAERAGDGAFPWTLDESWATFANDFVENFNSLDPEVAKSFRKDVCATLADSDDEIAGQIREKLERQTRATEFVGSVFVPSALGLDGNPFDWNSLRGKPILLVSGDVDTSYAPNYDRNFIPRCVDAGLQIVRYYDSLEKARNDSQRRLEKKAFRERAILQGYSRSVLSDDVETAASLAPADAASGAGDWPYEHGLSGTRFAVLFDADGRVVATTSTFNVTRARTLGDELRRLFPEIPLSTD